MTDGNLPRAGAQGLLFGVHRKTPGGARSRGGVRPVVAHMALGAGGPGSIPPWRALSKSLLFPSRNIKNTSIRSSEPQKVTILTTDENLPRTVAQGLLFGVHRKSLGRPGCKAGVAQWLGTRPWERAVPVRSPPGALCRNPSYFQAKTQKTLILGPPSFKKSLLRRWMRI